MNKSFHSVWNASKQAYVAAAETVSAKGKPSSGVKVAAVMAGLMGSLMGQVGHAQTAPPPTALPTGGQVSAGQARIGQSGANMVIHQSSDRAAINWQSFNVGKDAKVQFAQPNASSVTLNRVLSNDPSQIFGQITANGQVILTNPSGVYFGKDARVDVGGLIATTHGMSDADFMASKNRLERNGSTGKVVNEGEIKAALGGYIALLAPEVRNQGAVIAQMGTVALAAGEAFDLKFDSNNRLTSLRVEASQIQALVDNRHAVKAPGGLVIISAQSMERLVGGVVKNSGTIEATGLQQQGGRMVLSGSTRVQNAGSLDVSSTEAAGQGGSISVQGENIELQSSSRISATGPAGGGTVLVGGNWQGSIDPLLQATAQPTATSTTVNMANGATIDASATQNGDGGKVVLWSDVSDAASKTFANGSILALGGLEGGDGGNIETSGYLLDVTGITVKASSTKGIGGNWLLDPFNITIAAAGPSGTTYSSNYTSGADSIILASDVVASLNAGTSVTLTTGNGGASGGDITVNSAIAKSGGGDATLTLNAHRDITIAADITSTNNKLNQVFNADSDRNGDGAIIARANIASNGGNISFGGSNTYTVGTYFGGTGTRTITGLGSGTLTFHGNVLLGAPLTIGGDTGTNGASVVFNGAIDSGNTYALNTSANTGWANASTLAANAGGYLVTVTSALENSIVRSVANGSDVWLGASNTGAGVWKWRAGPENDRHFFTQTGGGTGTIQGGYFNNWTGGEPSNAVNGPNYLQIWYNNGIAKWDDVSDAVNKNFIVETTGAARALDIRLGNNPGTLTFQGAVGGGSALSSLNALAASISANGTALITSGAQTYNNALTVNSPGNFNVAATTLNVTNDNQSLLFKATGNIVHAAGTKITTNRGDVTYWADSDANSQGHISLVVASAGNTSSITTGGGNITMGGGTNIATGYAYGYGTTGDTMHGINIDEHSTLNSGAGAVTLRGATTATLDNWLIGVRVNGTGSSVSGGNLTFVGNASGAFSQGINKGGWGTAIVNGGSVTGSGTINLSGTGGSGTGSGANHGVYINSGSTLSATGTGTVTITGQGGTGASGTTGSNHGIALDGATAVISTTNGNLSLTGTGGGGDAGSYNQGVAITSGRVSAGGTGTVSITGTGGNTNVAGQRGVVITTGGQVDSAGGAIAITGSGGATGTGDSSGISLGSGAGTTTIGSTTSGAITLTGTGYGTGSDVITYATTTLGNSTATSNITLNANSFSFTGTTATSTGALTIQPRSTSFSSAVSFPITGLTLGAGLTSLTLGKTGNLANITIGSATSIAGPISIYGGDVTLNAGLTSTGTNTIMLSGTGNVTDGAGFVSASNLALLGGNVTLDNTSNAIGTLAASGVSGLTYVDSNALTIGTVGGTTGIRATGVVSVSTLTDNLTLGANVRTDDTSVTALSLNAGKNANVVGGAPGTDTGGNLLVTGTPTVTLGAGGTAKLFTGRIDNTTLTALVGSGSGRFRYNADETTDFATGIWTNIGTGLNAIYRERPSASGNISSATITYGDATPNFTIGGVALQNGDGSSGLTIVAPAYSTANKLRASGTAYTVSAPGLAGLGYNVTGVTNGALRVNVKGLGLGFSAANKVYDGLASAGISGVSLEGLIPNDAVNFSTGSASFNDKNIGSQKTVSLDVTGFTSGNGNNDAANYTLSGGTAQANITAKELTIKDQTAANKVYDATTTATLTGGTLVGVVSGDNVTLTQSGTFESRNVGKGINILETNTLGGAAAGNYTLTQPTLKADITPKALSTGLTSANKVYDGTTTAAVNGTLGLQTAIAAGAGSTTDGKPYSGDVVNLSGSGPAKFNSKNVAEANTVTFEGLSLTGAQAGNYTLATAVHRITPAPLAVTANNKTKFVTTADPSFTLGYAGFVSGETESTQGVFSTAPTVSVDRSSTLTITNGSAGSGVLASKGAEAAGTYANALVPTFVVNPNANYTVTATVTGSYTIVPAEQLRVIVEGASATYGVAPVYRITSAEYLPKDSSTPVIIRNISVDGNTVSVNDGLAGTSATFNLVPVNASLSTSSQIKANTAMTPTYQLDGTNLSVTPSVNPNFKSLAVEGTLSVTPKPLTPAVANLNKVYDGTTSAGASIGLTSVVTSGDKTDDVRATGVGTFATRNAGANTYAFNNLALSGNDASNYILGTTSLTGTSTITAKLVTLTPKDVSRVYNGQTTYTPTAEDLAHLSGLLGVSGDTVSAVTLGFADKNAGTGKTLNASAPTVSDSNGGSNYAITFSPNTTSSITRLNSVTWVGGASGNWFDPANWAGGAVPDLSNVANVVIPTGVTVSFGGTVVAPAQSGAVNIDGLTGAGGNLSQSAGTLNVGTAGITLSTLNQSGGILTNAGPTNLDKFIQSGGKFDGTGKMTTGSFIQTGGDTVLADDLTVTQDFSQGPSGSLTVGGNTSITDTSSGVKLGKLTSKGALDVTSTDGPITQDSDPTKAITVEGNASFKASTGTNPAVPANITLDNPGNNFVGPVSVKGANVTLADVNDLILGDAEVGGDLTLKVGGNVTQDKTPPQKIVIDGKTDITAGGNVVLDGENNDFKDTVNVKGDDITITDKDDLKLGDVEAAGDLTLKVGGNVTQDNTPPKKIVVNGKTDITAGGNVVLDGENNDFKDTVNVKGDDITITDQNDLKLGDVEAAGDLTLKVGGNVTQDNTPPKKIVVDGKTDITAGGNVVLDGKDNDFKDTVNVTGDDIKITDKDDLKLGDVEAGGDLTLKVGGNVTQDNTPPKKIVVDGKTDITAGGNVVLDGSDNDFKDTVTVDADNVRIKDKNDLKLVDVNAKGDVQFISDGDLSLGNTKVNGALDIDSRGGNVTQTGPLVVTGKLDVKAGSGNVDLSNKDNELFNRVTVLAANSVVSGSLEVPARELASKLFGNSPVVALPGTTLSNANMPQPLMLASASQTLSQSAASSGSASTGQGNAIAGISVELRDAPSASGMSEMVAVTLPKGMSTSGTSFSFELPESVRTQTNSQDVRASLTDGGPLPAWLKFDAKTLRFESSAVPANALPLQLALTFGNQRILVVISERAS